MASRSLAVFAYAFPHRKTHDFLAELAISGCANLCVIAAPWRELKHADETLYFPSKMRTAPAIITSEICAALAIPYYELAHEDVGAISELVIRHDLEGGVISGARILKRQVIELFKDGVVNFHPGSLPDTAGLDSFYHTIRSDSRLGITAHFIDHRVDAGREIFFEETAIGPDDGPEVVQYNNYQSQIRALRRLVRGPPWGELHASVIERPTKNEPLSPPQKREILANFPLWRNSRHQEQQLDRLFTACRTGDCEAVSKALHLMPSLLERRSPEGWTPLIVASFHQHQECVRLLLKAGADPNAAGRNGTTVLMYAKTAVLNRPDASLGVLDMLLGAGGDLSRRDAFGRDINHYVREAGDRRLAEWLKGKGAVADD